MVRLAWIAIMVSGCLFKPNKLLGNDGGGDDGSGSGVDASHASLGAPRVVGKGYFSGAVAPSQDTSDTGYAIVPSQLDDGDLLLMIGTVDDTPIVTMPAGFSLVTGGEFGADTQTYWVFEKKITSVADEPPEYAGVYMVNGTDHTTTGRATILLVAIQGASPVISATRDAPNDCFDTSLTGACGQRPNVIATSQGAPTTQPGSLLMYASGVDWFGETSTTSFEIQPDFTMLAAFGDYGVSGDFTWSSMMVGFKYQDVVDASPISGTFQSTGDRGMPWAVALPLSPD